MLALTIALALSTQTPPHDVERVLNGLAGTDEALFPSTFHVETQARAGGAVDVAVSGVRPHRVLDELRRETMLGALLADDRTRRTPVFLHIVGAVADAPLSSSSFNPRAPRRRAPGEKAPNTAQLPFGAALSGFRIAISAGHGWLDNGDGTFRTQRSRFDFDGCGPCRGIVEDFFTADTTTNQVIPLLQRMGAEVILVRDPDHDEADPIIIDDGATGDSGYAELEGAWGDGASTTLGYLGDYRTNEDTDPGRVAFAIPSSNVDRHVSLRFPEGTNRTQGAVLSVVHGGGVHTVSLDQTRMGRFWLDLGSFAFPNGGAVELAHGPSTGFMIADAIKVGGGLHPASRHPWWQMSAEVSVVEFGQAPADVLAQGDVTIRPAYAEFVGPDLYVSIHANASGTPGGTTANGTSVYRYSCGVFGDHSSSVNATSCDDPPGSTDLLDEVHAGILASLRADWDPGWGDRGRLVADFGEVRVLDDTPGVLVETGFFDNLTTSNDAAMADNRALHDPRWREAFAIGLARGITRFLAPGTDAPPARPEGVVAQNAGDGTLRVSWSAVDGALGYRVSLARIDAQRSVAAFDEGRVVEGATSLVLDATTLDRGDAYAFRVSALDDNGEGFASQAVVARFRGVDDGAATPLLIVWAYDRRDSWVQDVDNDLTGAVAHAAAMPANVFFDGALDEGALAFDAYRAIDFAAGKDSQEHAPLTSAQMSALTAFIEAGGAVILSGEEVGYALVEIAADAEGATFLRDQFHATYVADDADTFTIAGADLLADLPETAAIDDGVSASSAVAGGYEVQYPDVYEAQDGAAVALAYADGSSALIVGDRTALLGFGLEALVDDGARAFVVRALLDAIAPEVFDDTIVGEGEGEAGEGEGEGEQGGEGEGEGIKPQVEPVTILPPANTGCGCTSAAPSTGALFVALLLALRRRRTGA